MTIAYNITQWKENRDSNNQLNQEKVNANSVKRENKYVTKVKRKDLKLKHGRSILTAAAGGGGSRRLWLQRSRIQGPYFSG